MSNANQPLLETGQIIPAFTLPGSDGMLHSLWDYKQHQHLILLLTRSTISCEIRGLLRTFAKEYLWIDTIKGCAPNVLKLEASTLFNYNRQER